ncbi:MAG: BREX-1 system adenine-specific DNA-methyltransferase PglX [Schwartzia succinivorans]|uniref:BREX-1 system adenine-specific DNA-methyltransferase PglX n=1 Tax=Schwartzia succinivorans TaxID=55507 RepID=UPI0023523E33|nr:BREX-1 system adenine-specific DNA-methyltransferase PglX [Schwartzia succinivorans]MBE6098021.1 BREX-1 system adenine-specific DNA-methyltransferase PglX [Schwartzia succinivorans]
MNKTAIKNFAIWARNKLIEDITYQMRLIGIDKEGIKEKLPQSTGDVEFYDIGTRDPYQVTGEAVRQRAALVDYLQAKAKDNNFATAYENVIEEVAYTWFNRLIAIRFMEVNDYLPGGLRVLSSASANKIEPELVTTPFDSDLTFTDAERGQIFAWQEDSKTDDLFRMLFVKECNALNEYLPELFEKTTDYTELLLNLSVTNPDGVVSHLVHDIPEEDFNVEEGGQVEIIGWLYQYYNTEPKAKVFSRPSGQKIKKEEIPAATQLFTPDWIVRYMVQNSLGRMWVEGHEADPEKLDWQYYLPEAEQEPEVAEKLAQIREEYKNKNIEDIKFLDPCMGSGHILVYAFEVFMQLYLEQGYDEREAAECILTNNLYGLDIDRRAFQLAYFALFMKAREYNRRILSKGIELNICAIEESNGLETAIEELHIPADSLVARTVKAFEDAKEYGSILNIPAEDYGEVREYVQDFYEGSNLFMSAAVGELKRRVPALVKQAEIMSRKYEVVVTNPPYMEIKYASDILKKYVYDNYYKTKLDFYAVFMKKSISWLKDSGLLGMITQQTWMFISSYDEWRKELLNYTLINMAHLGSRAFDEISGEKVKTTAFIIKNASMIKYHGVYKDLTSVYGEENKRNLFIDNKKAYISSQSNFNKIPAMPIAYWASDNIANAFSLGNNIDEYIYTFQGIITGDNDRFLRFWHELNLIRIAMNNKSLSDIDLDNKYWIPYNKGGSSKRWYGIQDYVVYWKQGAKDKTRGKEAYADYFLKEYISWSYTVSNIIATRYYPIGFLWDLRGSGFIDKCDMKYYLAALISSYVGISLFRVKSDAMSCQVENILQLPIIYDEEKKDRIDSLTKENIDISKKDWDSFENSWDFKRHPLLQKRSLQSAYETYKAEVNARFDQLKANEEELNRIFIDIYGLSEELTPEVADKDVTVASIYDNDEEKPDSIKGNNYVLTKAEVVKSLLSYAVGCMFGRYSLDVDGLAYAGGEWDESRYPTFYPDKDNIIPITDEAYSEDDIVDFFVAWMKKAFGVENLEENLAFIADALGTKGTGSRDRIRAYFLKDFYKDHVKTYKKRPIYWLYDSGKQNGFKALVYMHRFDEDTTGRVRADYLHRIERIYETEIARMTEDIDHSDNAREIGKATKRREKLQKQLKECQAYDEQIAAPALARIAIDLDDGVRVNYDKVQTVEGKKYNVLAKI